MDLTLTETQMDIQRMARQFAEKEILPIAREYDHEDKYPTEVVQKMRELGFFGALIPEEYGGMDLDYVSMALLVEELARAWMTISGVLGTHFQISYMIRTFGRLEQKKEFLPALATGERQAAFCLTEPSAGSDAAALKTTARKDGDEYVINGTKMFITNASHANTFAVFAKTDPGAKPQHRGISVVLMDRETPGFTIGRNLDKLGYKGLKTCELIFEDARVPGDRLLGDKEGEGFKQIMSALEGGRIHVAARCVGIARAAFEEAMRYAQQREAFGKVIFHHQAIQFKLAEMYTRLEVSRILTLHAAYLKNQGQRVDLEAGMAKLYASEACVKNAQDCMQVHGGYGYIKEFDAERYLRDAVLMTLGEGTSEVQRNVIARRLLEKYPLN